MLTKMFEVRDKHTFIPVLAIKFIDTSPQEAKLLHRGGFGGDPDTQAGYTLLLKMNDQFSGNYDPFLWKDRTMKEAHLFIGKHFKNLAPGEVIDIEFILGETNELKVSELA